MADITNPNAFLLKPRVDGWSYFLSYLGNYDIDDDYRLYVPKRFLLGNFERQKDNFTLIPGGIVYRNSAEVLEQCQRTLERRRFAVVKPLLLNEEILETIEKSRNEYADARERMTSAKKQLEKSAEAFCQFLNS